MTKREIKRLLILSIPYVVFGLVSTNLGEAWRMAKVSVPNSPMLGLMGALPAAFGNPTPSFQPFDLCVGVICGVGLRFAVYLKGKNAKKYRHNQEYGSARWGTEKDIKPFVDPKFENNVILTGTEFLTMNTRPKIPANARNLNCCIIGSSGSGKTRFWLTPQLLQAHSSYVVVDPKGGVLGQVGGFLQKRGYKIKVFNSIDFSKSMHYNRATCSSLKRRRTALFQSVL